MKLKTKTNARKRLGARGERAAALKLILHGYRIIARNVNMTHGELDIIAARGKYIVFVEVKTRTDTPSLARYGRPAAAVNAEKRRHMLSAIKEYLRAHPTKKQPRIDIIEVYADPDNKRKLRTVHIRSAFGGDSY